MSIPTQVFEHGRWVTRYADIHHVLAQNRDPETVPIKKAIEIPRPPSLGLFTKTIVSAPVVKWIIPARIRHPDRNDVLYITANSVEIKEAHGDYTLQHVAIKDDFDSPIKAARICGLRRELTKPDINSIIRKEEHWQDNLQDDYSEDAGQPMDQDTDMHVKEEVDPSAGTVKEELDDADALSMQAVPLNLRTLSPHILILALESGKVVFMYTVNGDADIPHIVTSQRPLWRGQRPLLDQVGRHIAVDPKSRAIAIAAPENCCYIHMLKPMTDLQKEVRKSPRIHPIVSEKALEVDGTILKMEFLYPPQNDPHQVILLLVVCKNGKSRLVWSEWSSAFPLAEAYVKTLSQILPTDERMPLLLIPTIAFTAFILVCENCISLYRDLLTGTPSRYIHKLHEVFEPEEAGSSKSKPIWVQWARVLRSTTHRAQGDGVYLCREDGIVHFLDIKYGHPSLIDSTHQVGKLDTNIDTSFAVLDIGPHCSDLLAAGGDGSEGGLWKFDAREHPKKIAKDRNWTPVVDCCTPMVAKKSRNTGIPPGQKQVYTQRIFACVGRARHGALSEFRYGIPASRHLTIPLKDLLDSGILAVWAFRNTVKDTFYLVLSHPKQTYLLRIRFTGDNDKSTAELVDNDRAFGTNERTVMIKALAGGRFVQVTERAVWTSSFDAIDDLQAEESSRYGFGSGRVLAACIGDPGSESLSLIAFEDQGKCCLQLASVSEIYKAIGETVEMEYQVTAVVLTRVANNVYAVVGSVCAAIDVFMINDNYVWQSVSKYKFGGDFAICESLAVSAPAAESDDEFSILIVCGLRNGSMQTLIFHRQDIAYETRFHSSQVLGHTPVKVAATASDPVRFVAQVEDQLYSLQYRFPKRDNIAIRVLPVWFTDDEMPEWQPGQLSTMTIVEEIDTQSVAAKVSELVRIDREYIHVAQINFAAEPENVHKRMLVGGTPTRAVYSERLSKVIVLNHRIKVIRSSRTVGGRIYPGKRTLQPVITFVDPDSTRNESLVGDDMDIDTNDLGSALRQDKWIRSPSHYDHETPAYEPGEKFLGIVEWFPKVGDNEFHMLIAHTLIRADDVSVSRSRLLLFSLSVAGGHIGLTLKKETTPAMPIYAVAVHPNRTSVVYHTGEELRILRLEATDTGLKWFVSNKAQLRSPARHITIKVPYIYVSTAGNSLAVFLQKDGSLEFLANDTVPRQGLHHLNLSADLTLISDMGNSITGLWQPPHPPRTDRSLSTLFEASLPQAVIRLQPFQLPIRCREGESQVDLGGLGEIERDWPRSHYLLIGVATTGAITQHRLLHPGKWPFLRFLQNLAERSPILCPFADGPIKRHLDPDRSAKPEFRAINGDILMRLRDRGGFELVRHLMNKTPKLEERYLDFGSVEDRWDRFKELFVQLLATSQNPPDGILGEDETVLGRMVSLVLQSSSANLI